MALPAKPILSLEETAIHWDITPKDIACYALSDSLTLSIVIKDIEVEEGEYIENFDGRWNYQFYGRRLVSGINDVFGCDIWSAFQNESAIIRRFRAKNDTGRVSICDPDGFVVHSSDLVLRHEEYLRFAQQHSLPVAHRKMRGGPGLSPQHDWEGLWIQACRRIFNDGLPETQAAFARELLDWYSETHDSAPDISTIKKKVSRLWKSIHA